MITVEQYSAHMAQRWDEAVSSSRNGTFLHLRGYMDYHSDRFADFSLMACDEGRVVAVMPACREGDTLYSHRGLAGLWRCGERGVRCAIFQRLDNLGRA